MQSHYSDPTILYLIARIIDRQPTSDADEKLFDNSCMTPVAHRHSHTRIAYSLQWFSFIAEFFLVWACCSFCFQVTYVQAVVLIIGFYIKS